MKTNPRNRVGLVVPHIFMHRDILPRVIFSPGTLALDLAAALENQDCEVTLFSPGPANTTCRNITADLSYFQKELEGRGDTYMDLLKKHPFTFITLARQVQSELIARAYEMANNDELDIVHIYTNEEDIALPFAKLCKKPVVFTHHDPFNFLVKYKNNFPKYKDLNWISMSLSQQNGMPADTNWAGNIYHGLPANKFAAEDSRPEDYIAFLGRIIEPKGVHLAIEAVKHYNKTASQPLKLKIAGKHYADHVKDSYWKTKVEPQLDSMIEYVGFIGDTAGKQKFLAHAKALVVPSVFDEPFGMVSIEALACGTPVLGLDSGAIPEIITHQKTGMVAQKVLAANGQLDEQKTILALADAIPQVLKLDRPVCRHEFLERFTIERMAKEHLTVYDKLIRSRDPS